MSDLQLYYDDTSFNILYSPPTAWADNSSDVWTGGTSKVVTQFPGAQLTFTFNGTSALFYGVSLNDSTFAPIIDGLTQPRISLPSSNPPTYGPWYRTPSLQPGSHKITFNDLPQVTLDYIIVDIDPNTKFDNVLALISDTDPGIDYSGSWQTDVSRFQTLQPFEFVGDYSTRSSCNPGDTMSFSFAGSAIQFWGVFDWTMVGEVTAAFIIDGRQVAQQQYVAQTNSQQRIYGVQTNFPLFSQDGLTAGSHHVVVNITSCNNQRFSLDYVTYTPSFTSDGLSSPLSTVASRTSRKVPKAAITGFVIGGVVLLLIANFVIWFLRRRNRRKTTTTPFTSSMWGFARKEKVPPHLRSTGTVDLGGQTLTNETWVLAPIDRSVRNINEIVSPAPPPAYPDHEPTTTTETTTQATPPDPTDTQPLERQSKSAGSVVNTS